MSVNIVNQTTGELTQVAGNATDKVGNLSAATTTDKSSVVAMVNELNSALANYASLDIYISNSGEFPDANTVTKELVYINGFQSGLTNYPSEVSNTAGILFTRWFYYSGDLTVARMQLVFTLGGLSFCRFTDGTSWTPWQSTGVGILSHLTTTDKISCVGAINEVNGKLEIEKHTTHESHQSGKFMHHNPNVLTTGNIIITKIDSRITITANGVSSKTTDDWIGVLQSAYIPSNDIPFTYYLGASTKSGVVKSTGYIDLKGLNNTDPVSLEVSFNLY